MKYVSSICFFSLLSFTSAWVYPNDVEKEAMYALTPANNDSWALDSQMSKPVVEKLESVDPADVTDDNGKRFQFPSGILTDLEDIIQGANTGIVHCIGGGAHGGILSTPHSPYSYFDVSTDGDDGENTFNANVIAVGYEDGIRLMPRNDERLSLTPMPDGMVRPTRKVTKWMLTKTTDKVPGNDPATGGW